MDFILKDYQYVSPIVNNSSVDQIKSCISQIQKLNYNAIVLKQTFFVAVSDNSEFVEVKSNIFKQIVECSLNHIPTSIVCQAPQNDFLLAVEVITTTNKYKANVHYKNLNHLPYIVIESTDAKELLCGGITSLASSENIHGQSIHAFEIMEHILAVENMNFSDIVRQWNYIENIIGFDSDNKSLSQHYQIFNDVRTLFYSKCTFKYGYPAATGIGMNLGGVVIDFIALKGNSIETMPLKSPVQVDAHMYTPEVLKENSLIPEIKKSTPKFERAKIIVQNGWGIIYVSGTAAIKGQYTISQTDIDTQTKLTIDSINQLVSKENLAEQLNVHCSADIEFSSLRVYVKNISEVPVVYGICKQYYPNTPTIIVNSDVCRDDLLVEIEATCKIKL